MILKTLAMLLALSVPAIAGELKARPDLSEKDQQRVITITRPTDNFDQAEAFEARPSGAGTPMGPSGKNSFSQHLQNLDATGRMTFNLGRSIFKKLWVSSPSTTFASDGLGPLYNARSCLRCHLGNGRGKPPNMKTGDARSFLLRLSVPPSTLAEHQALSSKSVSRIIDPIYGGQLQDRAIQGHKPEGQVTVSWTENPIQLADGTNVSLRKPKWSISNPAYGPIAKKMMMSPRIANPMIGLGLLEAIHPVDIINLSDPEDRNKDGISGRINLVRNKQNGKLQIGRFGWKATEPNLHQQASHAFSGDLGLSTNIAPEPSGDCTPLQQYCSNAPNGVQLRLGNSEVPAKPLDVLVQFTANIASPARRNVSAKQTLEGKSQFYKAGCINCHTPKFVTSRDAARPVHRFQLIWPYTDLLLHDMGEGLSDHRPVADARGEEWRTPPLWGIGLTDTVSGHTFFLHDGRARNLEEAILWHGGEAKSSRDQYKRMKLHDRNALLAFLKTL